MISAVVHTYNEEKNIDRCLSSLSFVDEIVLVDMGSTDKTKEKAVKYKVKFYPHPYTGFVEPARNFGIQKATGIWILVVDADEIIPRTLADFLISSSKNTDKDYFRIPRQNIIFGSWIKHSGWWPDYQIRFFKKKAVLWNEKIHGVPLTKGTGFDLEPNKDLSIVHYNYQTIEQFISRLNRYTSIFAKELFLDNVRFNIADLFQVPIKEFINRFFVWEGYKDGLHGLALSSLQAFSELVVYLKLWELENFKKQDIPLGEIDKLSRTGFDNIEYWFTEKRIGDSKNIAKKVLLKISRKLQRYG